LANSPQPRPPSFQGVRYAARALSPRLRAACWLALACALGTSAASVGATAADNRLAAGLIAYWSFDQGFGADNGGSAYDFTAFNGAAIDPVGRFGGAARFTRNASQYLVCNDTVYAGAGDMSYMAWYRLDEPIFGTARYFVMETPANNHPVSYGLRLDGTVGKGQVFTSDAAAVKNSFYLDNGLGHGAEPGRWYNLIVTLDGATGVTNAYLDGVHAGTTTQGGDIAASSGLVLGAHRDLTGRNFMGLIDEVAFWSRVLTPAEIAALQLAPVGVSDGTGPGPDDPPLVFHLESPYRFGRHQHKVQLHAHTTLSDGAFTPAAVMQMYAACGYAAVALSDHDSASSSPSLEDPGGHGIIHIPAVEYSPGGNHMLGIGIATIHAQASGAASRPAQAAHAALEGGLSYICHPWDLSRSSIGWNTAQLLNPAQGYDGIEILNRTDYITDTARDFPYKVDAVLTAGREIQLTASDDFHRTPETRLDMGFVVINSDLDGTGLTLAEVMRALRCGNFYAAGRVNLDYAEPPRFTAIRVEGATVTAELDRPADIAFITRNHNHFTARQGGDACAASMAGVVAASYTVAPGDGWVRIMATVHNDAGPGYAWSNPVYVRAGDALPALHTPQLDADAAALQVAYRRPRGDATWQLQASHDLVEWLPAAGLLPSAETETALDGAYAEYVRLVFAAPGSPLYLRLARPAVRRGSRRPRRRARHRRGRGDHVPGAGHGLNFKVSMSNILTLIPSLTITTAEMDQAVDILDTCLD
jgi:hypothetical protein